ncbi:hypothetical protein MHYP_G00340240 [Metynnis hypsauchen]
MREAETALAHALDKKSARTIQPFRTGRERIRGQLRGSERSGKCASSVRTVGRISAFPAAARIHSGRWCG